MCELERELLGPVVIAMCFMHKSQKCGCRVFLTQVLTQRKKQNPGYHKSHIAVMGKIYFCCNYGAWGSCPGPPSSNTVTTAAESTLKRAWESSQRSTKEDWDEWMRNFAVELLHYSSSPALSATWALAQVDAFPRCFWWGSLG
jgi:hypothetical protein